MSAGLLWSDMVGEERTMWESRGRATDRRVFYFYKISSHCGRTADLQLTVPDIQALENMARVTSKYVLPSERSKDGYRGKGRWQWDRRG